MRQSTLPPNLTLSRFPLKTFSTVVLLAILLAACQSGRNDKPDIPSEEIDQLLQNTTSGLQKPIFTSSTRRNDGAWFALAAVAEENGNSSLATELRKRSVQNDIVPFCSISLIRLLQNNPEIIPNALKIIEDLASKNGKSPLLRQARILALESGNENLLLAKEINYFTGESWEAPVLQAALKKRGNKSLAQKDFQKFIILSDSPEALKIFGPDLQKSLSAHVKSLLNARQLFADKKYRQALGYYWKWWDNFSRSKSDYIPRDIPAVFREIALSAQYTGKARLWAERLRKLSPRLHRFWRYGAYYRSGRLFMAAGSRQNAYDSFTKAIKLVEPGIHRDNAILYRLWALEKDNSPDSGKELSTYTESFVNWTNKNLFINRMNAFLYDSVKNGRWEIIETLYRSWSTKWPAPVRSRAAWILALAIMGNQYQNPEGNVSEYLRQAYKLAPFHWSGIRAAAIMNKDLNSSFKTANSPKDPSSVSSFEDSIVRSLLNWGAVKTATNRILGRPDFFSSDIIRKTVSLLIATDPRKAIKLSTILMERSDYKPQKKDLLLRYPLPLGDMPAQVANNANIPVGIFHGLIHTESAWDIDAVSRVGATGLTQFMPSTWREWIRRLRLPPNSDPRNPRLNAEVSVAYLNWLLRREWSDGWIHVLIAYNAGGGRLKSWKTLHRNFDADLWIESIPITETRNYVYKVLAAATVYDFLYDNQTPRRLQQRWGIPFPEVY